MTETDLLQVLARGEDSRHQFKRDETNADSVTIDAIRRGTTNQRNPTLTEHAVHLLPYRGLGTGIPRALRDWPAIELIDDVAANQFRVVVQRPASATVTPPVTPEVTPEVGRLLLVLKSEMNRAQLMAALGLRDEKHFRQHYQQAAVASGLIEMTVPDKPRSRLQRYRLTPAGHAWLRSRQRTDDAVAHDPDPFPDAYPDADADPPPETLA